VHILSESIEITDKAIPIAFTIMQEMYKRRGKSWRLDHAWIKKDYLHALLGNSVFASAIKWMHRLSGSAPEAEDQIEQSFCKTITWTI